MIERCGSYYVYKCDDCGKILKLSLRSDGKYETLYNICKQAANNMITYCKDDKTFNIFSKLKCYNCNSKRSIGRFAVIFGKPNYILKIDSNTDSLVFLNNMFITCRTHILQKLKEEYELR
ncbi:MAG: hypothetical protein LBF97_05930 [Elusimicrobiota bacterium]|jgi:hypothetical protein|nr:hypothetical protein [Elusimicrobiota bacterium]